MAAPAPRRPTGSRTSNTRGTMYHGTVPPLVAAPDLSFTAPAGITLAAALRAQLPGKTWREVRRLVERGKVTVGGTVELDPARRLAGGETLELRVSAPTPEPPPVE